MDERAKDRAEDIAATGATALVAMVPIFGGPLATILGASLGSAAHRRTDAELAELKIDVEGLAGRVDVVGDAVRALMSAPMTWWSERGVDIVPQDSFVGGEDQLRRLRDLAAESDWADTGARIAICGIAGVGKSMLAYQHAYEERSNYRTVTFVDGSSRESLNAALGFILGARLLAGGVPAADTPPKNCRELLIIDGVTEPILLLNLPPQFRYYNLIATIQGRSAPRKWEEVQVDGFQTDDDFVRFACAWFPSTKPDDAKILGEKFDGNPLAIGQALAFCNTTKISVDEYLKALDGATGGRLLYNGAERTRNAAVAEQIELSLIAARTINPDSEKLLILFALFGETAVNHNLLKNVSITALLMDTIPDVDRETVPNPATKELAELLQDKVRWLQAINTLREYWLIKPDNIEAFQMHSLVRHVVSLIEVNRRPYFEVALGCFLRQPDDADPKPVLPISPSSATQLATLLNACTKWKMHGLPIAILSLYLSEIIEQNGADNNALLLIDSARTEIEYLPDGEYKDQMRWIGADAAIKLYSRTEQADQALAAAKRLLEISENLGSEWLESAIIIEIQMRLQFGNAALRGWW